jgi:hypothetical protein
MSHRFLRAYGIGKRKFRTCENNKNLRTMSFFYLKEE